MTLYTSDKSCAASLRIALKYLLIACGVGIAGAIYEVFGHGVYSNHMIYAFAFPLLLGCLPNLLLAIRRPEAAPGAFARDLWGAGIAALTTGSVFQGILSIYGTSSRLVLVYVAAGIVLMNLGLVLGLRRKSTDTPAG